MRDLSEKEEDRVGACPRSDIRGASAEAMVSRQNFGGQDTLTR